MNNKVNKKNSRRAYKFKQEKIEDHMGRYQVDRVFDDSYCWSGEKGKINTIDYYNCNPVIRLVTYNLPTKSNYPLNILSTSIIFCLEGEFILIDQGVKFNKYSIAILPKNSLFYLTNIDPIKFMVIQITSLVDHSLKLNDLLDIGQFLPEVYGKIDNILTISNSRIKLSPFNRIWKLLDPSKKYSLFGPKSGYQLPDNLNIKLIRTRPGRGPSKYRHLQTIEHFLVLQGEYAFTIDCTTIIVEAGQMIQIRAGYLRNFIQLQNPPPALISQQEDGLLLSIGTNNQSKDISYPNFVRRDILSNLTKWDQIWFYLAQKRGLKFEKY